MTITFLDVGKKEEEALCYFILFRRGVSSPMWFGEEGVDKVVQHYRKDKYL